MRDRVLTPELMDDPALDADEHTSALTGLARLNRLSRADAILWPHVRREALQLGRPLRVLDVATGSGDVPLALALRARREHVELDVHLCDISERALAIARTRGRGAGVELQAHVIDVTSEEIPGDFDVVTCSLFMHHLPAESVVRVLDRLGQATGRLLLVSDLRRTHAGLGLAWAASRVTTTSHVVHVDAVRSVRAAFSVGEFSEFAAGAGLEGAEVSTAWPQRMLLKWRRA